MSHILDSSRQIMSLINKLDLQPILTMRNRHFFMLDVLALLCIPALALTIRLDSINWWPRYGQAIVVFTIAALGLKVSIFYQLGLYRRFWRYASIDDLVMVLIALVLSFIIVTATFMGSRMFLDQYGLAIPRNVLLIDGMLTGLAVTGLRLGVRGLYHWYRRYRPVVGGRRVLVVGAGEAGAMIVREMRANPELDMEPVAFVDDDPAKVESKILGLPVLGPMDDLPGLADQYQIQRIVIAIPSASLKRRQQVAILCAETGIATHTVPGMYELLAGHKTIDQLPEVDINHLLRREPVELDHTEVSASLNGTTVLVTGAGGSIGRELCHQIARCEPATLILLGHGENSIFEINLDLQLSFPDLSTHPVIADVRDQWRINRIVEKYRPDVIFHAAAHKHVPFMEANVEEAITNNILGTQNVVKAAEQYKVKRFILISTDKAVNAVNTMGATKRMAEMLVVAAARRSGGAYMAVRFGNVLGSRGSVIPIFQRQIAAGGPLTITDPDMYRYFMTIPEAVQLVLQASVLGQGGEVFVLDMGQPVRVLDLATDLLKLFGLKAGRDIDIVYSGIRPGEKLNEQLFLTAETHRRTKHPKIFAATPESIVDTEIFEQVVLELVRLTRRMQSRASIGQIRQILTQICYYIDSYQPKSQPSPPKPSGVPAVLKQVRPLYPRSHAANT